jgi:CMP-N,N'-diacetyllegionaminic acid synthase
MYRQKHIVGVVPARGGSKGLPGKNIRPLLGKPLLAWTLEQARSSRYLDRVFVSTDSPEIQKVAQLYGGDVPVLRPATLAVDTTSTIDVLLHVLNYLEDQGDHYDYLALLEPTSPLREAADIDRGVEQLVDHPQAKALVSVTRHEGTHPVFNSVIDPASGCLRRPEGGAQFQFFRRQDLTSVYYFEGTLYISDVPTLIQRKTFYHDLTLPYIVPRWQAPEIDELLDFVCIESILKARQAGQI